MVAAVLFSQMWRVPKVGGCKGQSSAVQKAVRRPVQGSAANGIKSASRAAVAMRAQLLPQSGSTASNAHSVRRSAQACQAVDPHAARRRRERLKV